MKNRNNTSGIKGISWHKASGKWCAYTTINKKRKWLGLFNEIIEAIRAHKAMEVKND